MERTVCFGRANAVCRGERCKIRFLRPFVGTDDKESKLSTAICRGGRLCPPSKSVDFSWIFVGADAHIGPPKCCDFALDFRKNGHFPRADRVVRPYGAKSKPCTITPFRPPQGCFRFGGGMGRCGHRPLRRKTGECYVFPRPFVGADAHIGPPRRRTENAAVFRLPAWFFIPLVGADDSVRPLNPARFYGSRSSCGSCFSFCMMTSVSPSASTIAPAAM